MTNDHDMMIFRMKADRTNCLLVIIINNKLYAVM